MHHHLHSLQEKKSKSLQFGNPPKRRLLKRKSKKSSTFEFEQEEKDEEKKFTIMKPEDFKRNRMSKFSFRVQTQARKAYSNMEEYILELGGSIAKSFNLGVTHFVVEDMKKKYKRCSNSEK